jgi:hypothetical protein
MGNGQWAMGNGQWAMGNGQWAMGNGQWAKRIFLNLTYQLTYQPINNSTINKSPNQQINK